MGLGPLNRIVRLVSLTFEEGALDEESTNQILGSLKHARNLQTLVLHRSSSDYDDPDWSGLIRGAIGMMTCLRRLSASNLRLSPEVAAAAIRPLLTLEDLDLSCNCFEDGASTLAPALALLTALTHLDLRECTLFYDRDGEMDVVKVKLRSPPIFSSCVWLELSCLVSYLHPILIMRTLCTSSMHHDRQLHG